MKKLTLILFLFPMISSAQISAKEVLEKAVNYHDPQGEWATLNATLFFNETRPDGSERTTSFTVDNAKGYAKIVRGEEDVFEVMGEEGKVLKGDKDADRALMMRNYYLYLWGLPMKLNDEGTAIDESVGEEVINGVECYVLRVAYEKDTWYFSIDKETGRMLQYTFYQDAEETKGELITLEDEISIGSMIVPQRRSWYTLPDMKYLGTDVLDRVK